MWLDDYQRAAAQNYTPPAPRKVILDEKFTKSVRGSVQGSLSRNIVEDSTKNANAVIVTSVVGVGAGLLLGKSPVLFGVLGAIVGALLVNVK
jgi:type III secretory pathway component EscV